MKRRSDLERTRFMTMTYRKPKIEVLGDAVRVILAVHDKCPVQFDDSPLPDLQSAAAYDLDE
jgi:hypothetical protein